MKPDCDKGEQCTQWTPKQKQQPKIQNRCMLNLGLGSQPFHSLPASHSSSANEHMSMSYVSSQIACLNPRIAQARPPEACVPDVHLCNPNPCLSAHIRGRCHRRQRNGPPIQGHGSILHLSRIQELQFNHGDI